MYIVNSQEMQTIDRTTIDTIGIPGVVLMENAGQGVVQAIIELAAEADLSPADLMIAAVCGKGNNGGDGFVIARHLLNAGADVRVYLLGKATAVKGDAKVNLDILHNMNVTVHEIVSEDDLDEMDLDADMIVDAIFGTGFSGAPRGVSGHVIERINQVSSDACWVVSVDAPSGVDMNTGRAEGVAIFADLTVSMALPKIGHLLDPGRSHTGDLAVVDIGVPPFVLDEANLALTWLDADEVADLLPPRDLNAHKGDFGKVAVLAGSTGMTGAAVLTCQTAMRAGAGLVKLGTPKSLNSVLEIKLTEVMTVPLPETSTGSLAMLNERERRKLSTWADVMAIGPGLSRHPETVELVWREVETASIPLVIDADGINALAEKPSVLATANNPNIVITPHPGEMARLLDRAIDDIQADPIGVAQKTAAHFNCVVVLKTAPALIATPDGQVWINSSGNPGLASGGSGDVLTGLIVGLMAQSFSPADAARTGVYLHGLAADLYAAEHNEYSLIASDLLDWVPTAISAVQEYTG